MNRDEAAAVLAAAAAAIALLGTALAATWPAGPPEPARPAPRVVLEVVVDDGTTYELPAPASDLELLLVGPLADVDNP